MDKYTLLIIDMQPNFEASNNPKTILAVLEEIKVAKEKNCDIIVVEYRNDPAIEDKKYRLGYQYKATHSEILNELEDYERASTVHKYECNGSFYIKEFLLEADCDFNIDVFRVCGVNTDACVATTVNDLADDLFDAQFKIVKAACNCDSEQVKGKFGSMFDADGKYNPFKAFNPEANIKIV